VTVGDQLQVVRDLLDLLWHRARSRHADPDGVFPELRALIAMVERLRLAGEQLQERSDRLTVTEDKLARLATIVEDAEDSIVGTTLDGTVVLWNSGAEALYGYSASEMLGRPLSILTPPERADEPARNSRAVARGERVERHETVRVRKDGARIDVSLAVSPFRDATGAVVGASAITRDITARKRAEARLSMQYEVSRVLAESASLREAAPRLAEAVCRCSGCDLGELWEVDEGADRIHWVGAWGAASRAGEAFEAASRGLALPRGVGLPGRVWKDGEPAWMEIADDPAYVGAARAAAFGLRWAIVFPIRVADRVTGVMAFLSGAAHEPEPEFLRMMADIGQRVGMFRERKRGEEELVAHRNRLRALSTRLLQAREDEAKRIAHALHDEAGQLLVAVRLELDDLARTLPGGDAARMARTRALLDQIEEQLRRLSHELRPMILDDLGLAPALRFLAEGIGRRSGLAVVVESSVGERLPPLVETAVYRIVQEALTNVARHAAAARVDVRLSRDARALLCSVADDGRGFDVDPTLARRGSESLGLVGMRERADALGGTLEIGSAPGQGTRIQVTIPLDR
jgi:PAS domain S-box-containing protein